MDELIDILYRGARIVDLRCKGCGRVRTIHGWQLPNLAPLNTPIEKVKEKLKCKNCGDKDIVIECATGLETGTAVDRYEHFEV